MRTEPWTDARSRMLPSALLLASLGIAAGVGALGHRGLVPWGTHPTEVPPTGTVAAMPVSPEDVGLLRTAMLQAGFGGPAHVETVPPPEAVVATAQDPVREAGPAARDGAMALTARTVPLPVPRPTELARPPELSRQALAEAMRTSNLRATRRQATVVPVPPPEEPSLLDRIFGMTKPAEPAAPVLAYAALGGSEADKAWRKGTSAVPAPSASMATPIPGTAVYDITARTVHLPSGETLEAHSGYGSLMDDPRHVHVPMRGPTPPGTYDLTEREQPFHGVRALRLTPVGGGPALHGRVGLLAHTYMLRSQPGASNGCVVFRDYDKFLQAYLKGEIKRLVVVASR